MKIIITVSPTRRVVIEQDEYPIDPRKDHDQLSTMVCWHSRYTLGDEQPKCSPSEFLEELAGEELEKRREEAQAAFDEYETFVDDKIDATRAGEGEPVTDEEKAELRRLAIACAELGLEDPVYRTGSCSASDAIRKEREQLLQECDSRCREIVMEIVEQTYVVQTLNLYDHSGITISHGSSRGWDNGPVGYQYVSLVTIRKEWKDLTTDEEIRAKAEAVLEGELEEYDAYLRGDVYSFSVENYVESPDHGPGDWESEDSCSGFIGDPAENGIADYLTGEDLEAFREEFPEPKQKGA